MPTWRCDWHSSKLHSPNRRRYINTINVLLFSVKYTWFRNQEQQLASQKDRALESSLHILHAETKDDKRKYAQLAEQNAALGERVYRLNEKLRLLTNSRRKEAQLARVQEEQAEWHSDVLQATVERLTCSRQELSGTVADLERVAAEARRSEAHLRADLTTVLSRCDHDTAQHQRETTNLRESNRQLQQRLATAENVTALIVPVTSLPTPKSWNNDPVNVSASVQLRHRKGHNDQLDLSESELQGYEDAVNKLVSELNARRADLARVTAERDTLSEENGRLQDAVSELGDTLEGRDAECDEQREQVRELQSRLDEQLRRGTESAPLDTTIRSVAEHELRKLIEEKEEQVCCLRTVWYIPVRVSYCNCLCRFKCKLHSSGPSKTPSSSTATPWSC
jgi:chromosome segregation ATPase